MVYKYSVFSFPIPAQVAGEALEQIEKKHGALTRENVLKEARDESSVLHSCFTWDNKTAAEQFRMVQAGRLIRSVTVVIEREEREPQEIRAFFDVSTDCKTDPGKFINVQSALSAVDTREIVLERARRELEAFKRKYEHLIEFSHLIKVIDETLAA